MFIIRRYLILQSQSGNRTDFKFLESWLSGRLICQEQVRTLSVAKWPRRGGGQEARNNAAGTTVA